jgi:hypothetical protein
MGDFMEPVFRAAKFSEFSGPEYSFRFSWISGAFLPVPEVRIIVLGYADPVSDSCSQNTKLFFFAYSDQ